MSYHEKISMLIEAKQQATVALSDAIWAVPELHFQEKKSMEYMKQALEKRVFKHKSVLRVLKQRLLELMVLASL